MTSVNQQRRVVVTGIGLVTPLGSDKQSTWQNLVAGESGVSEITSFEAGGFPTKIAAQVTDFNFAAFSREFAYANYMSRGCKFGVRAADEAKNDASLSDEHIRAGQAGVCFGGSAVWQTPEEVAVYAGFSKDSIFDSASFDKKALDPLNLFKRAAHSVSYMIAIALGLTGPNLGIHTACASGNHAIGTAFRIIRDSDTEIILAGGCDGMITPMGIACFSLLGALSQRNSEPQKASRPFDRYRDGFVMGEGAGCLVLEELSHALDRGARIYAEVLGFGSSLNAHRMTDCSPGGAGEGQAMMKALNDAGISTNDVSYINAHGTSTMQNDIAESQAIGLVFKDRASEIAVSSIKSMIGHLIAASGAVEAAATVLSVKNDVIPPTINLQNIDPQCPLNHVSPIAKQMQVKYALKNSFGFGGQNAVLAFGKYA